MHALPADIGLRLGRCATFPRIAASTLLAACLLLVAGCGEDEDSSNGGAVETATEPAPSPAVSAGAGVIAVSSQDDVDAAFRKLVSKLEDNPDIKVVAEVDHTANARAIGEQLPEIREVIFGNPKLGTPADARAGRRRPGPTAEDPRL